MTGLEGKLGLFHSSHVICATDGSYDQGAAGWGVCIVEPETWNQADFAARVHGADQSSLAAETEAVERVLMANEHAGKRKITFMPGTRLSSRSGRRTRSSRKVDRLAGRTGRREATEMRTMSASRRFQPSRQYAMQVQYSSNTEDVVVAIQKCVCLVSSTKNSKTETIANGVNIITEGVDDLMSPGTDSTRSPHSATRTMSPCTRGALLEKVPNTLW